MGCAQEDTQTLYAHAKTLYTERNNKELEKLFSSHLKQSYDTDFWNLYIEYVRKVSVKKVNVLDVYAFVLNHFEYSYDRTPFLRAYIAELQNIEDDALRVERVRRTYHKALSMPMHEMNLLRMEYEKWETDTNRQSARTFIDQIQPAYANALTVYHRLLPHIRSDSYFKVFDIELENPLRLQKKAFNARASFIFKWYEYKFPKYEDILFLHSFYFSDQADRGIEQNEMDKTTLSPFLSTWYSFLFDKNLFNFEDTHNYELILINYLDWLIKTKGIEAFRSKFQEILSDDNVSSKQIGPHTYIYIAEREFASGGNKGSAYKIFTEAINRFPRSSRVIEAFFNLFTRSGDDESLILHFRQLRKTARIWERVAGYIRVHGTVEEYKELLTQWEEAEKNGDVLGPVVDEIPRRALTGTEGIYENAKLSFRFYDLRFDNVDALTTFISKLPALPEEENLLKNVSIDGVIELLKTI